MFILIYESIKNIFKFNLRQSQVVKNKTKWLPVKLQYQKLLDAPILQQLNTKIKEGKTLKAPHI